MRTVTSPLHGLFHSLSAMVFLLSVRDFFQDQRSLTPFCRRSFLYSCPYWASFCSFLMSSKFCGCLQPNGRTRPTAWCHSSSSPCEDTAPSRTLCTQHPDPRGFLSDVLVDLLLAPSSAPAAVDLAARILYLFSVTISLSSRSLIWPISLCSPLAAFALLAKPRRDRTPSPSRASRPSRPAASTAAHTLSVVSLLQAWSCSLALHGNSTRCAICARLADFTVDLAMTFTVASAKFTCLALTLSIAMPSFSSLVSTLICWMRSQRTRGDPTAITCFRRMGGDCAMLLLLLLAAVRSRDSS